MASNFGAFAANFLQGLTQAQLTRQRTDQEKKKNKLLTQLLEVSLQDERTRQEATQTVANLITGKRSPADVGLADPQTGLVEEKQLERLPEEPMNLLGVLADPEGQLAAIQSGNLGEIERVAARESRTNLATQLRDSGLSPSEFFASPEGAAAGFEAGAPGNLFQDERAAPAPVRILEAAGISPMSEEGREFLLSQGATASDEMMKALQLQIEALRINELRTDQAAEERTERQSRVRTLNAINTDFKNSQEIIDLQSELENTALSVGIPFGDFMRNLNAGGAAIASMLGFDVSRTQELLEKRDRLKKLFASGVIDSLSLFEGTGAISVPKFQALQDASPTMLNRPGANALLLADRLEAALDAADIDELEVENRSEIEHFIKQLRTLGVPDGGTLGTRQAMTLTADRISGMTIEQIQKINVEELTEFSEDQKAALSKRLEELGF